MTIEFASVSIIFRSDFEIDWHFLLLIVLPGLHGTITGHITHRAPLIIRIFFLVHTPNGINIQCGTGQGSGKQYQNKINN